MSMDNIGERGAGPNSARTAGKKCMTTAARALSPSRITRAKGRDTLLEEELKKLNVASEARNGVLNIDPQRVREIPLGGKGTAIKRNNDSNIFGEAKSDPQPTMRVRPVLADDHLAALRPVDTRKEDAANRMAGSKDMVSNMVSNQYPVPINKELKSAQAKKRYDEPAGPIGGGVDGFGNLGAKSHAMEDQGGPGSRRPGVSTKPIEQFVPESKPSSRFKGKRMVEGQEVGSHVTAGIF